MSELRWDSPEADPVLDIRTAMGRLPKFSPPPSVPKEASMEESHRPFALLVLYGLQHKAHIYGGTVTDKVRATRRRKNKQARASRRANRKG